jgi:hypothetical protein
MLNLHKFTNSMVTKTKVMALPIEVIVRPHLTKREVAARPLISSTKGGHTISSFLNFSNNKLAHTTTKIEHLFCQNIFI